MVTAEEYRKRYAAATPGSRALSERAERSMPAGVVANVKYFAPYPLFMKRAGGSHLWDVDGNEYIDYCLAFGPLILGHGHPAITTAVNQSLATWGTTIFGTPNELEVRYVEKLLAMVPFARKARLTNSGSEATYLALQIGRAATGRSAIARFEGHYHGWHYDGVTSIAPRLGSCGDPGAPLAMSGSLGTPASVLEDTLVLPFNDLEACTVLLRRDAHRVGTVILEPSPRAFYQTDPAFLQGLRRLTAELGMVLVFDEVMSGFRSGPQGAAAIFGVEPDLMSLGKIIGGGLPVGAVVGRADLLELVSPRSPGGSVFHSGTFNGTVPVLAAGLATLEILGDPEQTTPFYERTEQFKRSIAELLRHHRLHAHVAGLGANFGIIMSDTPVRNYRDTALEDTVLREAFDYACLTEGMYVHPHKPFYTSLVHTSHDFQVTLERMDRIFADIVRD